jgi:glucose-1-phosphate adenylyltransferase
MYDATHGEHRSPSPKTHTMPNGRTRWSFVGGRWSNTKERNFMNVFALILAGGESSGLSVLVEERPTAAMPFAGKYRIIDFTLSNCANSRLSDVAVLTQYRPHSLNEHVGSGRPWDLDRTRGGIHLWQPYRGRNDQGWQRGTADALYQNRNFIADTGAENLLVLSGDHVYKQDYRPLLRQHTRTGADLTISVRDVPRAETSRFGIVALDGDDRVTDFWEKSSEDHGTLASMGVYVFRTAFLLECLERDAADNASSHDFGRDIIPAMVRENNVHAYRFDGYWEDVGTLSAYWRTNLELLDDAPRLDLYDKQWTIHTRSEERPPVKQGSRARVERSLLSNGCVIEGSVFNSVLSPGVVVEAGAEVRDSIIMTDTVIAAGARVDRCIIDKRVMVGRDAHIGVGEPSVEGTQDGLTIIGKAAVIPDGIRIGRDCRIDAEARPDDFPTHEIAAGSSVEASEPAWT